MYNYKMVFFCIINHGASKIHTYMSRGLLHLPRAKFLRTELLGSTVHMSRYLIYKVCQGDSIESAPTSTRAFLALYFCSNNLYAVEHGVCTCQWGYVWRPEGDVGVLFLLLSTPLLLQTGSPTEARAWSHWPGWQASKSWVHLQMRATMTSCLRGALRSELTSLCLQSTYFTCAIPLTPNSFLISTSSAYKIISFPFLLIMTFGSFPHLCWSPDVFQKPPAHFLPQLWNYLV